MKIKILPSLLLITAILLLASCNRDQFTSMSDDDIAQMVDGSISELDGGAASDMTYAAAVSAGIDSSIFCGVMGDTVVDVTSPDNRYMRTGNWNWQVNCTSGAPSSISFEIPGATTFYGDRFYLTNTFLGNFVVTGLGSTAPEFVINGSTVRTGTGSMTVRKKTKEFSYVTTLTFIDVKLNKFDYKIISGTGTVLCVGGVIDGSNFSRTANIVLLGQGTYKVTLDNGEEYTPRLR